MAMCHMGMYRRGMFVWSESVDKAAGDNSRHFFDKGVVLGFTLTHASGPAMIFKDLEVWISYDTQDPDERLTEYQVTEHGNMIE